MYYVRNYNNIRYPVPELHHIYFGFGEGMLRFNQCWLEDPDREEQGTFDRIRIQNVRWNNCYDNFLFFKHSWMQKIGEKRYYCKPNVVNYSDNIKFVIIARKKGQILTTETKRIAIILNNYDSGTMRF